MKRPMFVMGTTFALATWAAFFLPSGQALLPSAAAAVTGALFLVMDHGRLRVFSLVCLSAAVGLACCSLYQIRHCVPFEGIDGDVIEMQGMVTAVKASERSATLTVRAEFPSRPDLPPATVQVYSYGSFSCSPGDSLRFLASSRTAAGNYYAARGIRLTGSVQGKIHVLPAGGPSLQRGLLGMQSAMLGSVQRNLSPEAAEIIGAMALGHGSGVSPEIYDTLNRSGTSHLLAVSGLHLSILTAFLMTLLQRLRTPPAFRYPLVILGAFLFAGLVGFSASIMRAFIMAALSLLAQSLSRRGDPLTGLGLALLLIALVAPHWTLGRGLWLSAASTLGILVFAPRVLDWLHRRAQGRLLRTLLDAAAVSLCAYIFALPVLLAVTGWFSVVSPLANMLAAPFVVVMLLGGIVVSLVFLPARLIHLAAWLTELATGMTLGISRWFAALPFAAFALDEFYLLLLLGGVLVGAVVVCRFGGGKELVCCAISLLLLCYSAGALSLAHANRDIIQLVSLEQCGVAILLRQDSAVLLGAPTRDNTGLLIRYLDYRGVTRINAVVAPDYPGQVDSGLLRLQARYGVDCLVGPDDAYIAETLQTALPQTPVFTGGYARTVALDGVVITTYADKGDIKVEAGGVTVLKSGTEYAIMDRYRDVVQISGDGYMALPPGTYAQVEPLGRHLFGESRILLEVEPGSLAIL